MKDDFILCLRDVSVGIPAAFEKEAVPILKHIDLSLQEHECVGIIGGSGAGKSVLLNAIIASLREPLKITSGEVLFKGQDLLRLSSEEMQSSVLGKQIATICPNPHWRLDPINCIGDQISDLYMSHSSCKPAEARARVLELLRLVGIPDPEARYNAYPHELSGGMAQRVLVTMALICEPKLLLADEPTGGLDVTIQIQIFNMIRRLIREEHRSTIIASRDIGLIYHLCDRVYVLYEGRVLESGKTEDVIHHPVHPYTARLVQLAESTHEDRQSAEYRMFMKTVEATYQQILQDHRASVRDGYIDIGQGHKVEVRI